MKLILTTFALLMIGTANAQTRSDVNIYGYVQPVIGGANPTTMPNESGTVNEEQGREKKNYYIYLSAPAGQRVYPTEIWIEGKQYSTRTAAVASPVELTIHTGETDPKKKTLVARTTNKVYQITPSSATPNSLKTLEASEKLAFDNDVVVSYKLGSKMYYAVLKALTPLEAAAMQ